MDTDLERLLCNQSATLRLRKFNKLSMVRQLVIWNQVCRTPTSTFASKKPHCLWYPVVLTGWTSSRLLAENCDYIIHVKDESIAALTGALGCHGCCVPTQGERQDAEFRKEPFPDSEPLCRSMTYQQILTWKERFFGEVTERGKSTGLSEALRDLDVVPWMYDILRTASLTESHLWIESGSGRGSRWLCQCWPAPLCVHMCYLQARCWMPGKQSHLDFAQEDGWGGKSAPAVRISMEQNEIKLEKEAEKRGDASHASKLL